MNFFPRYRLQSSFFFAVAVVTFLSLPEAVAQEGMEQQTVSQEVIENFKEVQKAAREKRIEEAVQENKDWNRPARFFSQVDALLSLHGTGKWTDTARSDGVRHHSFLPGPGKIAYIKPGWGIDNSELIDREFTLEVGFRWFF